MFVSSSHQNETARKVTVQLCHSIRQKGHPTEIQLCFERVHMVNMEAKEGLRHHWQQNCLAAQLIKKIKLYI